MKLLKLSIAFLLFGATVSHAQVGINTTNPHPTAVLHIYSTTEGVLLPTISSSQRNVLTTRSAAEGLLVYDSAQGVYYFFRTREGDTIGEWIALNPFQTTEAYDLNRNTNDVRLASRFQNRNVVIGGNVADVDARLHVKGNIRADSTIRAEIAHVVDSLWSKKIGALSVRSTVAKIDTIRTTIVLADTIHAKAIHSNSLLPIGTIVMWTPTSVGGVLNVPDCWEEVVELRGRFPIGAGLAADGHGRIYPAGSTRDNLEQQGQAFVRLEVQHLPEHSHAYYIGLTRMSGHSGTNLNENSGGSLVARPIQEGHRGLGRQYTQSIGSSQSHENRPPFYGVFFIRKISNNCPS